METCIHTPIGWLLIDYEDEVIERIRFSDTPADCVEANTKVIHELRAYFAGKLTQFTVKPKLPTNSFIKRCMRCCYTYRMAKRAHIRKWHNLLVAHHVGLHV